jgi:hypothetical protein
MTSILKYHLPSENDIIIIIIVIIPQRFIYKLYMASILSLVGCQTPGVPPSVLVNNDYKHQLEVLRPCCDHFCHTKWQKMTEQLETEVCQHDWHCHCCPCCHYH